jgi:hypothetical protein
MRIVPIMALFGLSEVAGAYVAAMICLLVFLFVVCVMCWVLCAGPALHSSLHHRWQRPGSFWLTSAAFCLLCCAGAAPQGAFKCCL